MAPFTVVDFVAAQLRAAAPGAEWIITGVDRAQELALIFVRAGVRDLAKLKISPASYETKRFAWSIPEKQDALTFLYEGRSFGFMGTPDRQDRTLLIGEGTNSPILVAWSAVGHGHVSYELIAAPSGFAVAPHWGSSSDWGIFRDIVKTTFTIVVSFYLPLEGIALGDVVGGAVMGAEFAAAYPAATSVIGNVIVSTAVNGGDVEAAAKGAVLGAAGAQTGAFVGDAVTSATNLEIIGKSAGAAASALVQGRDINQAVAYTLVSSGVKAMEIPTTADDEMGPLNYGDAPEVAPFQSDSFGVGFQADPAANLTFDAMQTTVQPSFILSDGVRIEPPIAARPDTSGTPMRDVVSNVSFLAVEALKLVRAYNGAQAPQVLRQSRAVLANGSVVTAMDNGTIQTRDASGRVMVNRPPVGVPQSTINGNLIVNNGDGTYTVIDPSGMRRVIQYGTDSQSGGVMDTLKSLPWPLILGAAGLGVAILKRK